MAPNDELPLCGNDKDVSAPQMELRCAPDKSNDLRRTALICKAALSEITSFV
jgi:hypothetical protein